MDSVIVAYSSSETAQVIKKVLQTGGFTVSAICTTTSQVLERANTLDGGIVVSSIRLTDKVAISLEENLPSNFELLILASGTNKNILDERGIENITLPLNKVDLIEATSNILHKKPRYQKLNIKNKPKSRNEDDKKYIEQAKAMVMEKNHLTEMQAHRYIQKKSMDMGKKMIETAMAIIAKG